MNEGRDEGHLRHQHDSRTHRRLRTWLERLLIWRVRERMLEIEFSTVASPLPEGVRVVLPARDRGGCLRSRARTGIHHLHSRPRLGLRGDSFSLVQASFASSDDIRRATGLSASCSRFSSRPRSRRHYSVSTSARGDDRRTQGPTTTGGERPGCVVVLASLALLGALRDAAGEGAGIVLWAIVALAVNAGLWWFTAWLLLSATSVFECWRRPA